MEDQIKGNKGGIISNINAFQLEFLHIKKVRQHVHDVQGLLGSPDCLIQGYAWVNISSFGKKKKKTKRMSGIFVKASAKVLVRILPDIPYLAQCVIGSIQGLLVACQGVFEWDTEPQNSCQHVNMTKKSVHKHVHTDEWNNLLLWGLLLLLVFIGVVVVVSHSISTPIFLIICLNDTNIHRPSNLRDL